MKQRLLACLLTLCLVIGLIAALGLSASATSTDVATVTADGTTVTVSSFADAVNVAKLHRNCTVTLLSDTTTAGVALDGDYTIDLNGKTLTTTAELTLSAGILTITDSAAEQGSIVAQLSPAIVMKGGTLKVNAGKIHSEVNAAIQNLGTGPLYLSGTPVISTNVEKGCALYVAYPNTLNGADGDVAYSGEAITVDCGWVLTDGSVFANNATVEQFALRANNSFVLEAGADGKLVLSQLAHFLWIIIAVLIIAVVGVVVFTIVHTVQFKRSMKFYSFSLPAMLAVLMTIQPTQLYLLIGAGVCCVIAIIVCVAVTKSQNKVLAEARAAKAERDAAEAAQKAAEKAAAEAAAAAEKAVAEAAAEEAAAEEAVAEEPAAEEAVAEEAVAEEVAAEEAVAEEPVAEEPAAEEAAAEEAVAEEAVAEEAVAEEPVAEEPAAEEFAAEEAVAEETVAKEPAAEEVVAEEPVAEEAVAEEAVAEEAVAEEAVAEEAVAEEPAAEEAVAEEPAAPTAAKPDRVVIAETTASGAVVYSAYKKSFTARIIQSSDDVQERYEVLKNALLSYKKVNSRVSWSYDSIKSGRKQLAKFAIRGKSLCLFLALDPASLGDTKYNVDDAGDSKKYDTVPCRLRLSSKRSIKWGLELIEKLAEQEGLVKNPKYKEQTWRLENQTTESLIEKGLIKKIV